MLRVCLQVEDKQRAEARERKEREVEWKQKVSCQTVWGGSGNESYPPNPCFQHFFSEEEGVWHYNHRLHTRLAGKQQ